METEVINGLFIAPDAPVTETTLVATPWRLVRINENTVDWMPVLEAEPDEDN